MMKTMPEVDDNVATRISLTDGLFEPKKGHHFLKCNETLAKTVNAIRSIPKGQKGQSYERIMNKSGVKHEQTRSLSLPNDLDDEIKQNGNIDESCDTQSKLLSPLQESPPLSPSHESWYKTWPDRYDKFKNTDTDEKNKNTHSLKNQSNNILNGKGQVSLNEALKNISLAYSPVTKQLHLVEQEIPFVQPEPSSGNEVVAAEEYNVSKKIGHRRSEPGSFSSTISSLSDPSPSGSLLESDDRSSPISDCNTGAKPKKKYLISLFNNNILSWKPILNAPTGSNSVWKLFTKASNDAVTGSSPKHEVVVISSTALIPNTRPSHLPAKTEQEELRHREEFEAMVAAAKRKEALNAANKQKLQRIQLRQEEQQAQTTKHFLKVVLPNWESMKNLKKTKDMWWLGLPSSIRGHVWRLAIGNELNVTQQLYEICLARAHNRLNSPPNVLNHDSDIDQESSMDLIQLDISRTFPSLGIFQEGGPFSEVLHSLLAAYVCYRPDVGYLQGMSYIAAILILNMEQFDAFVCFANLLNRPLHIAAFTLNQTQMQAYFNAYNSVFKSNLPKLYSHFKCSGLMPDLYLLEWIYTVFAKAMPLDIACRVWDIFLRDGDEFIFRTALGILHLNQEILMKMDFLHGAQYLLRLPDDLPVDQLFKSIQSINTNLGKLSFSQIVDQYSH